MEHKPNSSTIKLSNEVGIKLHYPTFNVSKTLIEKSKSKDMPIEILKECTDYLYDDQQVYKIDEMLEGEFEQFVNNLTTEQYKKIKNFFREMPMLRHETTLVCKKCEKEHFIKLEGLLDFFV